MKTVILDADTLGNDISLECFKEFGEVEVYGNTTPEEVEKRIANADFVIINKIKLNDSNLKNAKCLKLICIAATGYDNVDTEFCRSANIAVSNVVGYSTDSVAQVTVSMALSLYTNLPQFNSFVNDGSYTKSGIPNKLTPVYHEIAGKTWGIVGYGNIGKKVGEIASSLGCNIIVNKLHPNGILNYADLDQICENSDIISIHTPLNDGTFHLISKKQISKMKKNAIVINVARGAVVDEEALCEAFLNGDLGGIGVDVYSTEPFSENSPYFKIKGHDNVCLTPHMAWGSYEARIRCINEMKLNIEAFLIGNSRNRV